MMRYRKLTSAGDYTFGQGPQQFYVDSPEAVAQAVVTRLKLWRGEWFLDKQEGTPFMQQVLGTNTAAVRDQAIRQRILSTQGVKAILNYSSTFNSSPRSFTVAVTIDTIYGTATVTL